MNLSNSNGSKSSSSSFISEEGDSLTPKDEERLSPPPLPPRLFIKAPSRRLRSYNSCILPPTSLKLWTWLSKLSRNLCSLSWSCSRLLRFTTSSPIKLLRLSSCLTGTRMVCSKAFLGAFCFRSEVLALAFSLGCSCPVRVSISRSMELGVVACSVSFKNSVAFWSSPIICVVSLLITV